MANQLSEKSFIEKVTRRIIKMTRNLFSSFYYKFLLTPYHHVRVGFKIADVDVSNFEAGENSDISDHLNFLNLLIEVSKPDVILELGTRGGESTRVLENYCKKNGKIGRSIDLSAAPMWLEQNENWRHYVGDDCKLGSQIIQEKKWPSGEIFKGIDFLFLDTSHEYLHTKDELRIFVPLMNPGGLLVLHDTNLSSLPSRRLSGKLNYGWDNSRGVTRAIEEHFEISIREDKLHTISGRYGFDFLTHIPWNNGMTIIKIS